MLRHQHGARLGQRHGAPHFVGEFAHVARPVVEQQVLGGGLADPDARLAAFLLAPLEEVIEQQRNLLAPLAQRRNRQLHDVEAVVQVIAEPSLRDQLVEIGVGGRHDPHVDGDRRRLAERMHVARLEEAEQLGLHVHADLADFVEEQRAAGGAADDAGKRVVGAGEGAAPVAEELAVEHLARHRRAVEGQEDLLGPRRPVRH